MADLRASFGKPFKYQVAAYRLRLAQLQGTVKWDDIWQAQHDRAFMVAGALKADLLADLALAVDKAVSEGTTLETFRKDFRAIVEKNGWHGWTGEGTKGGEAWRTRVIYRTNLSTSYAAGRMAQLIDEKYPFFVYRHGNALEPRLQHLAWDGLILAADHPFWASHAPPNGWGCTCRVTGARSIASAHRVGGKESLKLADGWQDKNPKTGAPDGIDKGWAYAPGASVADIVAEMAKKAPVWPYGLAKAFMGAVPKENFDLLAQSYRSLPSTADMLRRYAASIPAEGSIDAAPKMKTLGMLASKDVTQVSRLADIDVAGFDFAIDASSVRHANNNHGDAASEAARGQRAIVPRDFGLLGRLLNNPDSVTFEGLHNRIPRLSYSAVIDGERIFAIFEIRSKRQRLNLVTMWVGLVTGRPSPLSP
jgi:hypothetical protein